MKRSQVEIMGLLIIVVMISVILLFTLKYMLSPREEYQTGYTQRDISSSLIGAMLNTHSGCTEDTLMSKILIDCAKYPPTGSEEMRCDTTGIQTCEHAAIVIQDMLAGTLDKWRFDYEFKVIAPGGNSIDELNFKSKASLGKGSRTATFSQPLPVDTSGYKTMQIMLCIGGVCEI